MKEGKPDALSRRPEYGSEEGAMHREQQILQPQHFGKFQIAVVWGDKQSPLQEELPYPKKENLVRIQRLIEDARIPTRGSKLAARHNLYSIENLTIPAHSRSLIKTGLAIAVPNGTYGRIAPKSGLATKGILVDAGVIDADYRGELKVLLVNHSASDYGIMTGDRIAQLIVEKIVDQDWEDVEMLDETERADEGFGSTGLALELKETQPMICFLYSDGNHEFYETPDAYHHPTLQRGQILMSNAIIAKANLKEYGFNFLTKVQQAVLEDADWVRRNEELEYMEKEG